MAFGQTAEEQKMIRDVPPRLGRKPDNRLRQGDRARRRSINLNRGDKPGMGPLRGRYGRPAPSQMPAPTGPFNATPAPNQYIPGQHSYGGMAPNEYSPANPVTVPQPTPFSRPDQVPSRKAGPALYGGTINSGQGNSPSPTDTRTERVEEIRQNLRRARKTIDDLGAGRYSAPVTLSQERKEELQRGVRDSLSPFSMSNPGMNSAQRRSVDRANAALDARENADIVYDEGTGRSLAGRAPTSPFNAPRYTDGSLASPGDKGGYTDSKAPQHGGFTQEGYSDIGISGGLVRPRFRPDQDRQAWENEQLGRFNGTAHDSDREDRIRRARGPERTAEQKEYFASRRADKDARRAERVARAKRKADGREDRLEFRKRMQTGNLTPTERMAATMSPGQFARAMNEMDQNQMGWAQIMNNARGLDIKQAQQQAESDWMARQGIPPGQLGPDGQPIPPADAPIEPTPRDVDKDRRAGIGIGTSTAEDAQEGVDQPLRLQGARDISAFINRYGSFASPNAGLISPDGAITDRGRKLQELAKATPPGGDDELMGLLATGRFAEADALIKRRKAESESDQYGGTGFGF